MSKVDNPVISNTFLLAFHFQIDFIFNPKKESEQDGNGLNSVANSSQDSNMSSEDNVESKIAFSEVSGIGAELQIEEVAEGGENQFVHRLPKPAKYKNLVLKKALEATPPSISKWVEDALYQMEFAPCTVIVSIMKDSGTPIVAWQFFHAYPVKLEISGLDAKKSEIVIETLELAYRYCQRKKD